MIKIGQGGHIPGTAFSLSRMCASVLVALLVFSCQSSADIPVPGMSEYDIDYVIANIDDFSNNIFLVNSSIWGWEHSSIVSGDGTFGGGYKLDGFGLNAISAEDFDEWAFSIDPRGFCENNTDVIPSNIYLPVAMTIDEKVPLDRVEILLTLYGTDQRYLDITKTSVVYYYRDGTVEELLIEPYGEVPLPG